jgi:transposase
MHAIGIDMSKRTFHAAFDETVVRVFSNTEDGIAAFCASMSGHPTIGIEATGAYHLHFCSALVARGYAVRVLNPLESSRVIAAQGLRRVKTDRTDARAIRQAVLLNLGYPFTDTPEILALKALVVERHGLVRLGTMLKQQREAHQAKEHAVGSLHDSSTAVLAAIRTEILRIEAQFPRYAPETQALLRTIPGVGRLTAAALVAFVGDIRRFSTPEKLVAYLGLDCRVHESGTSIKGKGYLTKRGNKYLRHILFAAAFIARRHNPTLRAFFERKIEEGKHYTVALCAVERKLVHLIFAVWTRGTPYESR